VRWSCSTIPSKNHDLSPRPARALTLRLDVITSGIRLPSAAQNTPELIELTKALDGDEAINRLRNTKQRGLGVKRFSRLRSIYLLRPHEQFVLSPSIHKIAVSSAAQTRPVSIVAS